MRIYGVNSCTPLFCGQRQDRKAVKQLSKDNVYDINLPNQRRINSAIKNLSEVSGEDNVKFLIGVSKNLKYGTNIVSDKKAYNDWRGLLLDAARKSVSISDKTVQDKYIPIIDNLAKKKYDLTEKEQEILENKKYILSRINTEDLSNIKNSNIRNIKRNLEYFIVSSEVPLSQKAYIMNRLAYFMSDEYEINNQLADKKTQALAEIINDIVVDTPESIIPNTKAVNQCSHGICGAISICRKALAYEDKANFVDMILSELDNNDYIMVYDINKLGSHTKIPTEKTYIDFKYALEKGYRIIDTSSMYWMHIADHAGAANERIGHYSAFDKKNYDTFTDIHINADIDDDSAPMQDYYRSLLEAKKDIEAVKKAVTLTEYISKERQSKYNEKLSSISQNHAYLRGLIRKIAPLATEEQINTIAKDILTLKVDNLEKAQEINNYTKNYAYMPKEDSETKINKINSFLKMALKDKLDNEILSKNIENILEVVDELNELNTGSKSSYAGRTISEANRLYAAAAAYRTQIDFSLDIPENLYMYVLDLNIPDNETILVKNMEDLIKKLKSGTLNPKIKEQLAKNFNTENTDESLIAALDENLNTVKAVVTYAFDELYSACALTGRRNALAVRIKNTITDIQESNDKNLLIRVGEDLRVKPDKQIILNKLNEYKSIVESDTFTEDDYINIYNKMGFKSQLSDLKNTIDNIADIIVSSDEQDIPLRRIFYQLNGLNPDASTEEGFNLYNKIAKNFNNLAYILTAIHQALNIEDENGIVLNSTDTKNIVLKKLENKNEIPTLAELNALRDRFSKIDKIINSSENRTYYKDLPKEYTTLTPFEKSALQKYKKNINNWYGFVKRNLDDAYQQLSEPLSELNRRMGVRTGSKYVYDNEQGLSSRHAIRIIEHMTDRPYYADSDLLHAVNIIKNSPYSGIGNEHLSANEYSLHAQYIADVTPLAKRDKDGNILYKDAIFYDNTWGAHEHNSNWQDKYGNLRTDYDEDYGVNNNGFIVNSKYQEGVYAEELKNAVGKIIPSNVPSKAYKKINNDNNQIEKYSMFRNIITAGIDPAVSSAVRSIRDKLLYSPYQYLDELEQLAHNMTKSELKNAMSVAQTAGLTVFNEYDKIERTINGDGILNKGINSLEEYNNLPDNSQVKIVLEKVAAILSYDNMPADGKMLYKEFDVSDIKLFRKQINMQARKDFDYTFAKDLKFYVYAAESVRQKVYNLLSIASRENGISIPEKLMANSINAMKRIQAVDFDGSLEHTLNIMVSNFKNYIENNTPDFDNKAKYIDTIGEMVLNNLKANTLLSVDELSSQTFNSENLERIANWIDKEFAPATDEEFVKIFNNLRNMPKADFESKYNSIITDDVIGIKHITGYDILKDLKNENKSVQNVVFNTIQQYAKDVEQSKLRAYYDYDKFARISRGAVYVGNRTFDDIYSDYYYSLLLLSRMKEKEKQSEELFKRYNAYFAYPKIEVSNTSFIESSLQALNKNINDYISYIKLYKIQKTSLELCDALKKRIERYGASSNNLNASKRTYLLKDLQELAYINQEDESLSDILSKIDKIIAAKPLSVEAYKPLIDELYAKFIIYSHTVDGSTMDQAIDSSLKSIEVLKKNFINSVFSEKYNSKAMLLLNKWIDAQIKSVSDESDEKKAALANAAFENFKDFYMKHQVFMKPEDVLNEFLLLNAKDASSSYHRLKESKNEDIESVQNELKDTIDCYRENLKGLLHKASLLELQTIIMDCAKSSNSNIVGKHLVESKLKLKDGSFLPLDADEGLQTIISPLLTESSFDTAALFFNQFGLAERITEMVTSNSIFNDAYKNIDRIKSILTSVNKQAKFLQDTLKVLSDIDNDENYEEKIFKFREELIKKVKTTNYRKAAEIYAAAIDDAIQEIKNQPEGSKYLILSTNMSEAISGVRSIVKAEIDNLNEKIRMIQNTGNLLIKLELPENSKANELRENFYKEIEKLSQYQNNQPSEYKYIGFTKE